MTNKDNNTKFSYAYFHNVHINIKRADFETRFAKKASVIAWFEEDCFNTSYVTARWVFRGIR
jgi:hypothetical protein